MKSFVPALRRLAALTLVFAAASVAPAATPTGVEPGAAPLSSSNSRPPTPLSMVVMDPLAAPLSCPCVEGYAQRDYAKLGAYLEAQIGRPVRVTFAESLAAALEKKSCTHADLIIGKDSVVRSGGPASKHRVKAVARLTDKLGEMTQTGLIVVRSSDPAQELSDLVGYRVLFGPADCDEKFAAPRALLGSAGVALPSEAKSETSAACSDGACKVIELGDEARAAAVISSYAAPLLEGCGTIKKGELRVVAETAPVPFITAFVTDRLTPADQQLIADALIGVVQEPKLLAALESLIGFVSPDEDYLRSVAESPNHTPAREKASSKAKQEDRGARPSSDRAASADKAWPGWAGPSRNGHAPWLPRSLPDSPKVVWRQPMLRPGLGGIAVSEGRVIVGDRDATNQLDQWRCLNAADGSEQWALIYPAFGDLDYDNCPRATPLIEEGRAYLFGAFGDLHCVELATGDILWQINLRAAYGADHELVWGCCSSPLIVDDKLIVNPGAPDAAWAALDKQTGAEVWRSPGDRHAYASPILAEFSGVRQIIAYDRTTLGGWDPSTGLRLWTLEPPSPGDFNVPTPVVVGDRLLIVTENNGARLHAFDEQGRIDPGPVAVQRRLSPDMSTPVVVGDRVCCVWKKLVCLNAETLAVEAVVRDRAFSDFGPLIASTDRLLTIGRGGELLLLSVEGGSPRVMSRGWTGEARSKAKLYSQPALVGTRLYACTEDSLACVDLAP